MKKAILQVADTGPLESLVVMLNSAGYECYLPSEYLRGELRRIGCDNVLDISGLVRGWGYDYPDRKLVLLTADSNLMDSCDLYVDIKAHRNRAKVEGRWTHLRGKVLWYRINGGTPEIVEGKGDEINPGCPILTPNLNYAVPGPWSETTYTCWPPFYGQARFPIAQRTEYSYMAPVCLVHNIYGWFDQEVVDRVRQLGIRCYGGGNTPDGLVGHQDVPRLLANALCMVHLKESDAPGYSLYEAVTAGCPCIISQELISRNRMEELFVPEESCLVYDSIYTCYDQVKEGLFRLTNSDLNQRLGLNAYYRLQNLMWQEERDGATFKDFMERVFP